MTDSAPIEAVSLEEAVVDWLEQVNDCDLGPNCNCVGHDDLLIMQIEMALARRLDITQADIDAEPGAEGT